MCDTCDRFGIDPSAPGVSFFRIPALEGDGPVAARGPREAGGARAGASLEREAVAIFGAGQTCTTCGFWVGPNSRCLCDLPD